MIKEYKNIGQVEFVISQKSKRLKISIIPGKPVKVTMPKSFKINEAEKFLFEKQDWIVKTKSKVLLKTPKETIFTEETVFNTKFHSLKIESSEYLKDKVSINISKTQIKVFYPKNYNVETENVQSAVKQAITETLKIEAKNYLPQRLDELAKQFNFKYAKISSRVAQTRWGSCSGINNISLNSFLMMLPDRLIDYVILHELCHTIEKNHGPRFWKLLKTVAPDSDKLKQELGKYSPNRF